MEHTNGENWFWDSDKWKFRIAFPGDWSRPRGAGPNIMSPGVDVYSQHESGASTAVFAYSYHSNRDIDASTEEILRNHRKYGKVVVLSTADQQQDDRVYRTIDFKFGRRVKFRALDVLIFCPNMQMVISSNALVSQFDQAKVSFERISNSLSFNSRTTDELPIRSPNLYHSVNWGYSIEFPKSWNDYRQGPFSDLRSADVRCDCWWGSSTAVFAYPRSKSTSIDEIADGIMQHYRATGRHFRINDFRDRAKTGNPYRTIFFEWTAPDKLNYNGHYAIMLAPEIMICVSSQARAKNWELDSSLFDAIVDSINFESTRNSAEEHT